MEWSTDRTWMYEMTNNDGFINMIYCDNVEKWLDFVYSKGSVVDPRLTKRRKIVLDIKCPCSRCQNSIYLDRGTIEEHLLTKGFMPNYYTWYEHGETSNNEVGQSSTARGVVTDRRTWLIAQITNDIKTNNAFCETINEVLGRHFRTHRRTWYLNVTWVDTRASEAYSTYNKNAIEKYGEDTSLHPDIDMELLSQTLSCKKKGRLYGMGNIVDLHHAIPGSSYPRDKSDNDEVQQLKEKVAELEQDKIEKHAMMEKIEEGARLYAEINDKIQLLAQNPLNPPPT